MDQSDRSTETGRRPDHAAEPSAALVRACRALAEKFVGTLHARVVASLQESLAAFKENGDVFGPDPLVEELTLLDKARDSLGKVFLQRFSDLHGEAVRATADDAEETGRKASVERNADTLSLVDDTQLEEWLAIDNLVAKIHERWNGELNGLRERYRVLLPRARINKYRLPIGPDKFCHAFHDALESVEIGVHARLYCYGLLDRALVPEIGGFYSQVNHFLIGKGILPALAADGEQAEAPRRRQPGRAAEGEGNAWDAQGDPAPGGGTWEGGPSHRRSGAARGWTGGGDWAGAQAGGPRGPWAGEPPGGPAPIRQQMFVAIQHLLGVATGPAFVPGEVVAEEMPVKPVLIDALSALQRDDSVMENNSDLIRSGLRHYVHGRLGATPDGGKDAGISRLDDETIDVISMIFDFILDDPTLPDFIKALIGRLQIPVLKVALIDREFFSKKSHPTRQLLNELAQAGAGWRDESEASRDRLYTAMDAIVRRVLDEFENDLSIFESLLAEFRAFLEDETRRFNAAQNKLLEAAKRAEEEEKLRAQVLAEIGSRVQGRELPEDIREFLVMPWRQYLTTLTLAGEERGPALVLIDDLIWSLAPKRSMEDRRRLTAILPGMLRTLEEGLARIEHPRDEVDRLIGSLQDYHFRSLKAPRSRADDAGPAGEGATGPVPATTASGADDGPEAGGDGLEEGMADIDWDQLTSFDDVIEMRSPEGDGAFERMIAEMGLEPERDEGPRIDDEFTALVRDLDVGTWVELDGENGDVRRLRLAWKGDAHSHFSFVNRQYKVVAERAPYELAQDFRDGRARIIENVALFDRAVDGVISGIMKLARPAAS